MSERESIVASLRGGWRLIGADPVRVLSAGALGVTLHVLAIGIARALVGSFDPWTWVGIAVALQAARIVLVSPIRAAIIGNGAAIAGSPTHALRRAPWLALVALLAGGLTLVVAGVLAAIPATLGLTLLSRGVYVVGLLLIGVGAMLGVLAAILVRGLFAYAEVLAVLEPGGPIRALTDGLKWGVRDLPALVLLVATGDLMQAMGAVSCGAGALPGYPYTDLAVVHRRLSVGRPA